VWTGGDSSCAPAPADYDHDGDADLALLCGPAWHFYNDDGSYKGGIWTGASTTYTPVPADYDGDGYVDVANFDSGAWHIWNYATQAYHGVWTGTGTGCIPAPGDYDGDGNADFALKCGPYWHFYNDNGSFARSIWTGATDAQLPVQGDYNGDGRTDLAVSNGAAWDIFDSISGAHTAGVWTGNYGTPVPMDYDGDGTTDVVVFTAGGWHVYRDDGGYDQGLWTAANTTPMHANFTGDRTEEPAIYSNGAWIIYSFAGMPVARHHYFPFGDELSSIRQDVEQMKLTGHERDLGLASSADDDLDYMHARHYNPIPGRFLAVDRHLGNPRSPQSWNRYCYAADNPLKYIDPDGESATAVWGGVAGGAEITGAAAVAGSAVAAAGVGIASWELGRWIGGVPVGDGSIDSHISDAMAAGILLFSKSKGGGRDSEFINHTVDDLLEELEAAKKAKDTERVQRIIRELKNRGHRNQGKARGGRREPKKGGNNSFIIGAYDSGSDSQLFNLFTAWELEQLIRADMSLDEERAAACGVGVSCPF
jgi:RHS repeat-associated protein